MKLVQLSFSLVGLMAVTGSVAQTKPNLPAGIDPARQNAIATAYYNRLVSQSDLWFDDGDFPRIIHLLKHMFEQDPSDFEIATDLGWMLGNVERYDEELAIYVRFRRENVANDPDSAFPEANFYFRRRQFSKVPPILEPTITRNPHGNNFRVLAHSYERMGLLQESRRVWNAYLKVNPADDTARNNLKRVEIKIRDAGKR